MKTILIIEDDTDLIRGIAFTFEKDGYRTICAAITVALAVIIVITFCVFLCRCAISCAYREIDEILDGVLAKKVNDNLDLLQENRKSKLAHKADKIVQMTMTDITQTKEDKETIQSFLTDMSHQIKTPLASVSMYTDLLLDEQLTEQEKTEFLQRIKAGTEKIKWMMDSLVNISRLEIGAITLNPVDASIKQTLQTAVGSIYGVALKKEISIQLAEFEDISVLHDKKWTIEVLVNLLENGVKYSAAKSEILISVEVLPLYTRISVTDYGIGIDSNEWNDIFKRFYRGENAQATEGVGIGLYLVRLILEKQQGYVMVNSKLGEFTTFSVFLQNCKK